MRWLDRDTVRAPHMTLCLSSKEFQRAARHCKVRDPGPWLVEDRYGAGVHTWERNGKLTCVVCVNSEVYAGDPIGLAAVLVHESVHVFQSLCDSIGESRPSREFEAYSIERIAERLMREFARRAVP